MYIKCDRHWYVSCIRHITRRASSKALALAISKYTQLVNEDDDTFYKRVSSFDTRMPVAITKSLCIGSGANKMYHVTRTSVVVEESCSIS